MNEWHSACGQVKCPPLELSQLLHGMSLGDNPLSQGWYSPGVGSRKEVMLPGTPGLASGSGGLLGWEGVLRDSVARNLGRKVALWSLGALPSTGLGARKLAVVTMTLGWVATGSWDQTHVVGGSSWGGGNTSLSQMLGRVSFRLARASWLPREGRAASWPPLSELGVTVVVMTWSSWPREASSPRDEDLYRGLVSSARTGPSLSSMEMLCGILAQELAVASMQERAAGVWKP